MFVVQIWCLYLVNRLLYGVLPETRFLTKTAEHDLSLTSITFDLGWPRVRCFQRMRRIDARRGTENFKALFQTEFELLTKTHQGALLAPIRSRVNPGPQAPGPKTSKRLTLTFHVTSILSSLNPAFAGVFRHPRLAGGGGGVKRPHVIARERMAAERRPMRRSKALD